MKNKKKSKKKSKKAPGHIPFNNQLILGTTLSVLIGMLVFTAPFWKSNQAINNADRLKNRLKKGLQQIGEMEAALNSSLDSSLNSSSQNHSNLFPELPDKSSDKNSGLNKKNKLNTLNTLNNQQALQQSQSQSPGELYQSEQEAKKALLRPVNPDHLAQVEQEIYQQYQMKGHEDFFVRQLEQCQIFLDLGIVALGIKRIDEVHKGENPGVPPHETDTFCQYIREQVQFGVTSKDANHKVLVYRGLESSGL